VHTFCARARRSRCFSPITVIVIFVCLFRSLVSLRASRTYYADKQKATDRKRTSGVRARRYCVRVFLYRRPYTTRVCRVNKRTIFFRRILVLFGGARVTENLIKRAFSGKRTAFTRTRLVSDKCATRDRRRDDHNRFRLGEVTFPKRCRVWSSRRANRSHAVTSFTNFAMRCDSSSIRSYLHDVLFSVNNNRFTSIGFDVYKCRFYGEFGRFVSRDTNRERFFNFVRFQRFISITISTPFLIKKKCILILKKKNSIRRTRVCRCLRLADGRHSKITLRGWRTAWCSGRVWTLVSLFHRTRGEKANIFSRAST